MFGKIKQAAQSLLGAIKTEKVAGSKLAESEQARYKEYVILNQYYDPSINGLYRTKLPTGEYLYKERTWTTQEGILVKTYPEFLWSPFNPVRKTVNVDVAALMNDFVLENLKVTTDGETEVKAESKYLRDVLFENDFATFFRRVFQTAASQRDAYVRAINTDDSSYQGERLQNKVKLLLYPPEQVFPVLWQFDQKRALTFRIYYRQEVIEQINKELMLYNGIEKEFYSAVSHDGSKGWIDNEIVEDVVYDYGGLIPMTHFGHNEGNDYFGRSTCEDIIDDIDHINLNFSAMWLLIKRMINPILKAKGMATYDNQLPVPTSLGPIILPCGVDGDLEPLLVEIASSHMDAIGTFLDLVRAKLPHYNLERTDMSRVATRPETTESMMEGFISYANDLMRVYQRPLNHLGNSILKVGKSIKDNRIIVFPMGPPVTEGVVDQIDKLKVFVDAFGKSSVILEKMAQKLEFDDAEIKELLDKFKEDEQAAKDTVESKRLDMTKALAEKIAKKAKDGEQPVVDAGGKPSEAKEEVALKNVYQLKVAVEQGAATPVDIRMSVFGEDEATARRKVQESVKYNKEMAEALAEIQQIKTDAATPPQLKNAKQPPVPPVKPKKNVLEPDEEKEPTNG